MENTNFSTYERIQEMIEIRMKTMEALNHVYIFIIIFIFFLILLINSAVLFVLF